MKEARKNKNQVLYPAAVVVMAEVMCINGRPTGCGGRILLALSSIHEYAHTRTYARTIYVCVRLYHRYF